MSIYTIGHQAPVDYTIDWGAGWLGRAAIVASRWSVDGDDPRGLTVLDRGAGERTTGATLSADRGGGRYTVRGHVLLSDGRSATRSLAVQIGGPR